MNLTLSDIKRYNRQILMPEWGNAGQIKLKLAKVVIVGIGGLGCPASLYLTAAGIGNLVLIDGEKFELSNLNRQVLGWQKDIGQFKVKAAKEKLEALNPNINVTALVTKITKENCCELINGSNVVVDALDNWKTRFILNEACIKKKIPLIHAGIYGLIGQVTTIIPGKGPCLRCIIPRTPPALKKFPVVGATPGLFAMLQVMETIKIIVGIGEPLMGKLLFFNGDDISFNIIHVQRNPNCKVCKNL